MILFDGGLRTRLSVFRGVLAPSLLLATVGVLVTAAVAGLAAWSVLDLAPIEALLLGAIIASTDAAAVFFLLRTGGLRLQSRVGATLEIESGTNDPFAVFLVIVLTEFILAGARHRRLGARARLVLEGAHRRGPRPRRRLRPGRGAEPHRRCRAGCIRSSSSPARSSSTASTSLVGGSGLLAVYVAGLVMANRPTRAYPSIVGFHDAATWLCQIVMFLVLGLLVTPTTLWDYRLAGPPRRAGPDLRRPAARGLALPLRPSASRATRSSSSPGSACAARSRSSSPRSRRSPACPTPRAYFNIAFFVVLVSLLVQGSTLTAAARRLGVALRQTCRVSRVEIDIPARPSRRSSAIRARPTASSSA